MTQIGVALITSLILAFLRFQAGLGISFHQMLRLLHITLFDRRDLMDLCTCGSRKTEAVKILAFPFLTSSSSSAVSGVRAWIT
jgi:hypothetical protein